jgi:hypothetical protein
MCVCVYKQTLSGGDADSCTLFAPTDEALFGEEFQVLCACVSVCVCV